MQDAGSGLEDDPRRRPPLTQANAEIGLLAAQRQRADPSHALGESAQLDHRRAADGHVGADDVANVLLADRKPDVRAPDDPVELQRPPPRTRPGEQRGRQSTARQDRGVGERGSEPLGPFGAGLGIVVEERDDLRSCQVHAGVASSRKASRRCAGRHADRGAGRCVGDRPALPCPREQLGAVVDDHEDLRRRATLIDDRADRTLQASPALGGVGADHDADVERRRRSGLRRRAVIDRSRRHEGRSHSARIVRMTRVPSRPILKFDAPWRRLAS